MQAIAEDFWSYELKLSGDEILTYFSHISLLGRTTCKDFLLHFCSAIGTASVL